MPYISERDQQLLLLIEQAEDTACAMGNDLQGNFQNPVQQFVIVEGRGKGPDAFNNISEFITAEQQLTGNDRVFLSGHINIPSLYVSFSTT
ncbi:hypothetical protein D3C73_1246760 [compost metagenome]